MDETTLPGTRAYSEGMEERTRRFLHEQGFPEPVDFSKGVLNAGAHREMNPLAVAAREGELEVIKWLVFGRGGQEGVDVRQANAIGETPIFFAVMNGHLRVVRWLVEKCGAENDMLRADCLGNTCFHVAALEGHHDVLQFLLERDRKAGGLRQQHVLAGFGPIPGPSTDTTYSARHHMKAASDTTPELSRSNHRDLTPFSLALSVGNIRVAYLLALNGALNQPSAKVNFRGWCGGSSAELSKDDEDYKSNASGGKCKTTEGSKTIHDWHVSESFLKRQTKPWRRSRTELRRLVTEGICSRATFISTILFAAQPDLRHRNEGSRIRTNLSWLGDLDCETSSFLKRSIAEFLGVLCGCQLRNAREIQFYLTRSWAYGSTA